MKKTIDMNRMIILDGGMGTMLQAAGMKTGARPEIFGLENPDVVRGVHEQYIKAGSNIIYANTFGANAYHMKGSGYSTEEVVAANIATAKKAAEGTGTKVALDIGPLGMLMEPLGSLRFEDAVAMFAEAVRAGDMAGADLIIIETMTDLAEARAALIAAKENSDLPVWVTMSFESSGRTFTGTKIGSMALTLTGLGADAIGINCSLGPAEILPHLKEMRRWTDLPLIAKPNAGLPDPATGGYDMNAEDFAEQMRPIYSLGVRIMGGCCGTTPQFIRQLSEMVKNTPEVEPEQVERLHGICSARETLTIDTVRVIGERLNPTGKKQLKAALRDGDMDYIAHEALRQMEAGADILDINVGMPGIDEAGMMAQVISEVQSITSLPLQIDSSRAEAVEAGLRSYHGKAIVNSVNGEEKVLRSILPLVKKYGAAVIGLTLDENGIPDSAEKRFEIAERILNAALSYGIPKEYVFIDCLTLTVSAQQDQAMETLRAIRMVHERLGLHCTLGVSNISFGLPSRKILTSGFLSMALSCGLDLPIVDPTSVQIMDAIAVCRVITGEDENCEAFIGRFAGREETDIVTGGATSAAGAELKEAVSGITDAVLKGLPDDVRALTAQLLETTSEMDIIDNELIPALDVVGEKYDKKEIFLPQLINAANAASAGFDLIKGRIASSGRASISKGKIVIATVEGDVHDIGKNIVKVVLENYGYKIIDLGKDVPVQKVVEAALKEKVSLVGLSALMTTTIESMARTIKALKEADSSIAVMVGGAVLTPEYAKQIGADYYAADAKASADIAKRHFGE